MSTNPTYQLHSLRAQLQDREENMDVWINDLKRWIGHDHAAHTSLVLLVRERDSARRLKEQIKSIERAALLAVPA